MRKLFIIFAVVCYVSAQYDYGGGASPNDGGDSPNQQPETGSSGDPLDRMTEELGSQLSEDADLEAAAKGEERAGNTLTELEGLVQSVHDRMQADPSLERSLTQAHGDEINQEPSQDRFFGRLIGRFVKRFARRHGRRVLKWVVRKVVCRRICKKRGRRRKFVCRKICRRRDPMGDDYGGDDYGGDAYGAGDDYGSDAYGADPAYDIY